MWSLAGLVVNAGINYIRRRQDVAEARAQAQITIAQRTAEHERAIEVEATRSTTTGWKDELVTIWILFIFTWPLFDDKAIERLTRLGELPLWLSGTGALIILAAAGIRRVEQVAQMTAAIRGGTRRASE